MFRSIKNEIVRSAVKMNKSEPDTVFTQQHTGSIFRGIVITLLQAISASYLKQDNKLKGQIDGKLRSKIVQKKAAQGLKTDGFETGHGEDNEILM